MTGIKYDSEKPRLDLLDWDALEGLALGLTFGANKYGANNWRGGINNSRLIASLLRHLSAIQRGEDLDPESGLPHIDLVGCNWMFLSYNFKHNEHLDDRPTNLTSISASGRATASSGAAHPMAQQAFNFTHTTNNLTHE